MKHYFNRYNILNFIMFTLLIFFILERISTFLIFQIHLDTIFYFLVYIISLRFILLLEFCIFIYMIIIDLIFRIVEFDSFKNSIKSYIATWKIRRFLSQTNVDTTFNELASILNRKQMIIKKANRSLLTLTVDYYEKGAIAKWTLPDNCESYNIMEELLAQAKRELNQLDNRYLFNDFIRLENGRTFISTTARKKNKGAVYCY